jgi:uncharacterized protein (TIGR04255 family)
MTTSFSSDALPSYKNPPVNEVVCGMRFNTPDKLRIPHIGLLWSKFRAQYPLIEHAAPIASAKGELLTDPVTGLPLQRVWFINKTDDQLIQFQFDRFYFNWRRRKGREYPRYNHVIDHFKKAQEIIKTFFIEFDLGPLKPIEYELVYINHIVKEEGWAKVDDLPNIFSDFTWTKKSGRFLPNPAGMNWKAEFTLPDKVGSLVASLKQATRIEDQVPLFVLELNARGLNEHKKIVDVSEWFDIAHEWIVRGFTDLTTAEMHKVWEREK